MFNPAHPGELIRETIDGIIEEREALSEIINGKQSVTPEIAIKLASLFGHTSAEFWLRVQENYDRFKTD